MDEALRLAYRTTDYLVCLDCVEWASIRIDQPLPSSLQERVGVRSWGLITAFNPRSESRPPVENIAAQRELFIELKVVPDIILFPAIGVGTNGWHEASFFVIGADQASLDELGVRYRQNAYVIGQGNDVARLRLLRD